MILTAQHTLYAPHSAAEPQARSEGRAPSRPCRQSENLTHSAPEPQARSEGRAPSRPCRQSENLTQNLRALRRFRTSVLQTLQNDRIHPPTPPFPGGQATLDGLEGSDFGVVHPKRLEANAVMRIKNGAQPRINPNEITLREARNTGGSWHRDSQRTQAPQIADVREFPVMLEAPIILPSQSWQLPNGLEIDATTMNAAPPPILAQDSSDDGHEVVKTTKIWWRLGPGECIISGHLLVSAAITFLLGDIPVTVRVNSVELNVRSFTIYLPEISGGEKGDTLLLTCAAESPKIDVALTRWSEPIGLSVLPPEAYSAITGEKMGDGTKIKSWSILIRELSFSGSATFDGLEIRVYDKVTSVAEAATEAVESTAKVIATSVANAFAAALLSKWKLTSSSGELQIRIEAVVDIGTLSVTGEIKIGGHTFRLIK